MRPRAGALAIVAIALVAPRLGAQEPASAPPGVVAPTSAAETLSVAALPRDTPLRAGAVTYRLSLVRELATTPLGTRTVEVSEATVAGAPTWLVAERRTGTAVATSDSLWLSRSDLAPVRWVATIERTQLAASFSRDSVFGAIQSYAGRSSFGAPVLPGAFVTPGMTERVVELLPLRPGYRASASLLIVDMGTPRALPAELVVEREERIRSASGEVDCWLVVLRAGALEERLWVDRSRRIVVRTEQPTAAGRLVGEL